MTESLVAEPSPKVWVRHFNFFNSSMFGLPPLLWVNLVRDPVERVISYFYYRRAGWNIVERHRDFPDEPLPDPAFLRKDFSSCVLDGDPECRYVEETEAGGPQNDAKDHRRQMMQFCGQEHHCTLFNSEKAMLTAMVRSPGRAMVAS